jgi:hypothetical protein
MSIVDGFYNSCSGMQVDLIKWSVLPVLKRFLGTDEGLELKVKSSLIFA